MIDIHHHCLPGVDDGPGDWSDALELCHRAADEGIDTIIATPHVLRGRWTSPDPQAVARLVSEMNDKLGGSPRIIAGSEYYFGHDAAAVLESRDAVTPLANSTYVLIEFASTHVPPRVEVALHQIQLAGWIPIIAHPERNAAFQQKPGRLAELVSLGAKAQVTLASVVGGFGSHAQTAAEILLDREIVHFLATDAHDLDRRPPTVRQTQPRFEERWGAERFRQLTIDNPAAVLASQPLPYDPEPLPPPRRHHWLHQILRGSK